MIAVAPAGTIVLAEVGLQIAHGDQAERHLVKGLLGLEVDQLGIVGTTEPMQDRDANRMAVFIDIAGRGRSLREIERLIKAFQTEAQFGAGGEWAGVPGQKCDCLPHRSEGFFGSIEGFEHAGQPCMPFTTGRIDLDCLPERLLGLKPSTQREKLLGAGGVLFGMIPIVHRLVLLADSIGHWRPWRS